MRKKYFATNIVMQLQFTVEHFLNLELFSCLQLGIFVYFSSTKYIYTTYVVSTYLFTGGIMVHYAFSQP